MQQVRETYEKCCEKGGWLNATFTIASNAAGRRLHFRPNITQTSHIHIMFEGKQSLPLLQHSHSLKIAWKSYIALGAI